MINEMRQGFETAYIDGSVVSNAAYRPQFVAMAVEDDLLRKNPF